MKTLAWSKLLLGHGATALLVAMVALPLPVGDQTARAIEATAADVEAAREAAQVAETERVATALGECGSSLSEDERRSIAETIIGESERYGYDPMFVQAIVEVESTCRPTARSHAGAVGLIQMIPSTARDVARRSGIRWQGVDALLRPELSLRLGMRYLAELEQQFEDPYLAVAAFNLGPGRVIGMRPEHARRSAYVRKILGRYEGLLQAHAAVES